MALSFFNWTVRIRDLDLFVRERFTQRVAWHILRCITFCLCWPFFVRTNNVNGFLHLQWYCGLPVAFEYNFNCDYKFIDYGYAVSAVGYLLLLVLLKFDLEFWWKLVFFVFNWAVIKFIGCPCIVCNELFCTYLG